MTHKRRRAKEVFYKPLLTFFENEDDLDDATLPDLKLNLPEAIHMLTLKKILSKDSEGDFILLRLEHIYSIGS